MYNAAVRQNVRQAESAARLAERQATEIVRGIMSVKAGRQWMLGKLEACHVFAPTFSTNGLQMAFAEGERNIGLKLLADIMVACPDHYILMMREQNERSATADARNTNGTGDYPDSTIGADERAESAEPGPADDA